MTHLRNIQKLFAHNHMENPLLESFDAGHIYLSSGQLVASDPLTTQEMPPFAQQFPRGKFPVTIHKERESNCVAYVEISFSKVKPLRWELALLDGQDIAELTTDEIFGYPVESGMGCFMDQETQTLLNRLEDRLYHSKGADFMGIYEEFFHSHFFDENGAIDQFASLHPKDGCENNIIAFETGYGEGLYASYIAFDDAGNPVKMVTEFIEVLAE